MQALAHKRHLTLITGASDGIGFAAAKAVGKETETLVITYGSDAEKAAKAVEEIQHCCGCQCYAMRSDISKQNSAKRLAESVIRDYGYPDLLILNAGCTKRQSFWELTEEDWQEVLQCNLLYNISLLRLLGVGMPKGSSVILTGSLMGIHPHSVSIPYGVSKAAGHALVKNLTKVLSPKGIRINAVAPGFVDTAWQKNKPQEIRKSIESKIALGRFASVEEVGSFFKLIADAEYMNGQVIILDGGYSYC